MSLLRSSALLGFCIILFSLTAYPSQRFEWPAIASTKRSFTVPDADRARLSLVIKSKAGDPLYRISCRNPQTFEDKGFDVAGDFACKLQQIGMPSTTSPWNDLLADEAFKGKPQWSRGIFWAKDFTTSCLAPTRTFRLRGMKLTLSLTDVETKKEGKEAVLSSFKFGVDAEPDQTALTAVSEDDPNCKSENQAAKDGLGSPPYPSIAAIQKDFELPVGQAPSDFEAKHEVTHQEKLQMPITDAQGNVVYELTCSVDQSVVGKAWEIVGDRWETGSPEGIRCQLFKVGDSFDFLSTTGDPFSKVERSRILPEQLYGKCGKYPDWGGERSFRFRGMEITIRFQHLTFDPRFTPEKAASVGIRKGTVRVEVKPDNSAQSPLPEQPRYADWSFLKRSDCQRPILNPLALKGSEGEAAR